RNERVQLAEREVTDRLVCRGDLQPGLDAVLGAGPVDRLLRTDRHLVGHRFPVRECFAPRGFGTAEGGVHAAASDTEPAGSSDEGCAPVVTTSWSRAREAAT